MEQAAPQDVVTPLPEREEAPSAQNAGGVKEVRQTLRPQSAGNSLFNPVKMRPGSKARNPEEADGAKHGTFVLNTMRLPSGTVRLESGAQRPLSGVLRPQSSVSLPATQTLEEEGEGAELSLPDSVLLKQEYFAMKDKEAEDLRFEQKLNIRRPATAKIEHAKKDWRYYAKIGSTGNLWADPHHIPPRRRHLVETPTFQRGEARAASAAAAGEVVAQDAVEARWERVWMERQLRRAFTQEQHARNLERYDAASQPRPGTAATGRTRPATAHSRPSTGRRPREPYEPGSYRPPERFAGGAFEVHRPASTLPLRPCAAFAYTTGLPDQEWEQARQRRANARELLRWDVERPDKDEWSREQARRKDALEAAYGQEGPASRRDPP